MADKELQKRVDSILSSKGQARPSSDRSLSAADDTQPAAAAAAAAPPARPRPLFSAFVDEYMARASELATHFIQVADTQGLAAAVQAIETALQQEPVAGLVQYALQLFLT